MPARLRNDATTAVQLPENEPVATDAASAPCKPASVTSPRPSTNVVVAAPAESTPGPVGDDSNLERLLREKFSQLEPGWSIDVDAKCEVTANLSVAFNGKLKVERQDDGTFTVAVEASGEAGVGEPGAGSARIGVGAGTVYHVKTAAEAADLADALVKHTVVTTAGNAIPGAANIAPALHFLGMKGDVVDAMERLNGYAANISEVKGYVSASAQLGDEFKGNMGLGELGEASAKAKLGGKDELKFDFEKGTLTHTRSLDLSGTAKAGIAYLGAVGGDAKATVSISTVYKLSPQMIADVKAGRISQFEATARLVGRATPDEVRLKGEIESGGDLRHGPAKGDARAKATCEQVFTVSDFDLDRALEQLMGSKWKVQAELGGAVVAPGVKFPGVKAEFSVFVRRKWESDGYDFEQAVRAARESLAAADGDAVQAQRAALNLR